MKKLRRSLIPGLSILLGLAFTFTSAAFADTVTVTTTADVVDGNVSSIANLNSTPGADGEISLREAITAANNTAGADEILFDSSLDGFPITLTGAPLDNANLSGDLDIRSDMTIRGNGKSLTIIQAGTTPSNGVDRVFEVFAPVSTTITANIENLTVRHGRTGISGAPSVNRGAGISVRAANLGTANLTVTDALVTLNTNLNSSGGGIDIIKRDNGSVPTLDILRSEISQNSAFQNGGGVICSDCDLTVNESLVSDNFSNENTNTTGGAGIFMSGPEATTANITNTTISGNRTNGSGAGISNNNDTVILDFVTVTLNIANDDNDAFGRGGGLRQIGGSGSITVRNSIVQGNTTNGNAAENDCAGTITNGGFNVVGAGTGFPVGLNDTTDPANLGPLQNNGGSTQTHALLCTSAAVDFADCGSITTDQIGNPRNDGSCDAGAYERQLSVSNVVTVTTADDAVDGNISSIDNLIADPGPDGVISLREAIFAANHTTGADEIQFSSSINSIPIVLDLPGTVEDDNVDGDLDILDCDGLTITGNGESNTIIDGNVTERILHVLVGDLVLTGVTIRNGDETASSDPGGGIRTSSSAGNLTIDQCTIEGNIARFGAGVYFDSRSAGGRILTLTNSRFDGNIAFGGSGGAFRAIPTDGFLIMDNCTIVGNFATRGAGVDFDATFGTAEISNSVISGNTATSTDGAGVLHSASNGIMTIRNCEISNNTAAADGGGVSMNSTDGTLTIINSTISNNRANRHGGGISHDAFGGVINLNFVTITQNIADDNADSDGEGGGIDIPGTSGTATVNIHNSIVQGNTANNSPTTDDCGNSGGVGTYVSQGGNVFGSGTGCPVGASDTTDPANLGPLQNNGGTTLTHALLAGSAAIDHPFTDCGSITTDQRGVDFVRPVGANCDAGAFEFGAGVPELSHEFVLLAEEDIDIDGHNFSEGDIHANSDIDFYDGDPSTHTGNLTAVDDIRIREDNTINGDITAGDNADVDHDATVTGTVIEHTTVAKIPLPTLFFTAGGDDITVEELQTLSLPPGSYDDVEVEKGATLILSHNGTTGEYFLDKLLIGKKAFLSIDASLGEVIINVVDKLKFDRRSEVMITSPFGNDSRFVTFNSLDGVTIEDDARVLGNIIVPEHKVKIEEGAVFKGAICAENIEIEEDVTFVHHSSTTPLPKSVAPELMDEDDEVSGDENIVDSFALEQNYPNPFNPTTVIRYQLPAASDVKLSIYNMTGQLVRTLVNGKMPAGSHNVTWNATDESGVRVASGVYLYVIRAGDPSSGSGQGFVSQKKLVLMK